MPRLFKRIFTRTRFKRLGEQSWMTGQIVSPAIWKELLREEE